MKSTKRAVRRHHRQRMGRRALRAYRLWGDGDIGARRRWAVRWHDNLAMCSCWMCGNPRRYWGQRTVQEQRQFEAARADDEQT